MKAAIYSPYLDTFGGGEKYMMTIAEILAQRRNKVDVILDKHLLAIGSSFIKYGLQKRFDLNLENVNFTAGPLGKGSDIFRRQFFLKKYDLLFFLTP